MPRKGAYAVCLTEKMVRRVNALVDCMIASGGINAGENLVGAGTAIKFIMRGTKSNRRIGP